MITLCKTCGTSYDAQPERCPICEDERQYVPASGQAEPGRQPKRQI